MTTSSRPILLVEDNADDEALALRAFKKNNISNEIVVARDGAEALGLLHGSDDDSGSGDPNVIQPVVVFLDLKLPKIDGIEVLRRIRKEPKTALLPVVLLTTSTDEKDIRESYACGSNSYVRKPVDFNHFMEAVRQLGIYWLSVNEPPPIPSVPEKKPRK